MAINFHIDKVNRRIYSKAVGLITFDDLLAHMKADIEPEAVNYSEIFDCTAATTNLTVEQVRKLSEERLQIAQSQPAGPVAVVATNDLFFGMFRMFDMLTETIRPIRVFRDIKAAEQWLDSVDSEGDGDRPEGNLPHLPKTPQ
jgi:hypothetical protein